MQTPAVQRVVLGPLSHERKFTTVQHSSERGNTFYMWGAVQCISCDLCVSMWTQVEENDVCNLDDFQSISSPQGRNHLTNEI